jgi:glycosyltransferase involved in cell wall biosynthesis
MSSSKRVAIVHDWLVSMRGGEKVVEALCELFPDADLYTLVYRRGALTPAIENRRIRTSFLQQLPLAITHHRYYLPLYPAAIGRFFLDGYDLVISSSSAAAKGIRVADGIPHICYCHTPMRYIWDQYDQYFGPGRSFLPVRLAMKAIRGYLQRWDVRTSAGVTAFIANSGNVQERIRRIYGRESTVIYPPVDTDRFKLTETDRGYYLVFSALVPYKRVDIAVEAFNRMGKRLVVAGTGPELERLKAMAGPNIEFRGWIPDADLPELYAGCKALIFPGEEDFGIVPVEAMASGKPVVAFAKGGAVETVEDSRTGVLFDVQDPAALVHAVDRTEALSFDPHAIHVHATKFERRRFHREFNECIGAHLT